LCMFTRAEPNGNNSADSLRALSNAVTPAEFCALN